MIGLDFMNILVSEVLAISGVFPGPFWVGLPHPNEFLGKNGELFQNNFGDFFQNIGAF